MKQHGAHRGRNNYANVLLFHKTDMAPWTVPTLPLLTNPSLRALEFRVTS